MRPRKTLLLTFMLSSFLLSKDLPLGSNIPMASIKMEGINGEKVSLSDVIMENGLLVNFTCNTCPWVVRWQDRYNDLARASKKNKIGYIAINPNAGKRDRGENMEDMKTFAAKYGHNFLYTLDKETRNKQPHPEKQLKKSTEIFNNSAKYVESNKDDNSDIEKLWLEAKKDEIG